ncbi:MAG: hypothetical protein WAN60_17720 [Candidatus Sulfotelmatobacter sp.]
MVVTVNVELAEVPPETATGFALKEQVIAVALAGLGQERLTLPLYPVAGVTVMAELDVLPAVMEAGLNAAAVSV